MKNYNLKDYDLYIVDLDGTLYDLRAVKTLTALKALAKPHQISEYLIVQKYRKLYRLGYSEKERFERLPDNAPEIINRHMLQGPGKLIHFFRSRKLIQELEQKMAEGKTVVVYSDYPVKEKIQAVNFIPDRAYDSGGLNSMKPDPAGIKAALIRDGLYSNNCLVIGDRMDKDGELARNLGADALIRKRFH